MLSKQNLCRWFLLPLTKREIKWNRAVMKDVLLDTTDDVLWIELQDGVVLKDCYTDSSGRRFKREEIDEQFSSDVAYFRQGQYSYMSDTAKQTIMTKTSMLYNYVDSTGTAYSDVKALGLLRHKSLKEELEDQIGVDLEAHNELLPAPKEQWFLQSLDLTRRQ